MLRNIMIFNMERREVEHAGAELSETNGGVFARTDE